LWRMLAAVGVVVCVAGGAEEWAVAAYLDGRGDLAQDAASHAQALLGAGSGVAVGVELLSDTQGLEARRVWQSAGEDETRGWQPVRATDANGFLRWVRDRAGGANLLVVFLGHGLAARTGSEVREAAARMLVGPSGDGLRARELGQALRDELPKSDARCVVVVLEACFGAGLETVHELADAADYLIAAPWEIASPGLPWDRLVPTLSNVHATECAALTQWLCGGFSDVPRGARTARCPLTIFDLSKYDEAKAALGAVCAAALRDKTSALEALRWAETSAGSGVGACGLVDAEGLATSLVLRARTSELRRAAERLRSALEGLASGRAGVGEAEHDSAGVTLFLPGDPGATSKGYERSSRLARETGWARVAGMYLRHIAEQASGPGSG